MRTTKRLVGKKLPMLGAPLVMYGITDNDENKVLGIEIHLFFEGGVYSSYTPRYFEWTYGDDDAEIKSVIEHIKNNWVNDEIHQMIIDAMEEKKVSIDFYHHAVSEDPDNFFGFQEQQEFYTHVLGLWIRGRYSNEVKSLAENSDCFKNEFAKAMKIPQMKITIARG
jgi:hypothetical protein